MKTPETEATKDGQPSGLAVDAGFGNWTRDTPIQPGYYWMRFYIEGSAQDTKMVAIRRGTADLQMQCGDGSWANLCNFDRCWWSGPLLPPALPNDKDDQRRSH